MVRPLRRQTNNVTYTLTSQYPEDVGSGTHVSHRDGVGLRRDDEDMKNCCVERQFSWRKYEKKR